MKEGCRRQSLIKDPSGRVEGAHFCSNPEHTWFNSITELLISRNRWVSAELNIKKTQKKQKWLVKNRCKVPVSSGMEAWSELRSFLKLMLPSWRTADTVFRRPDGEQDHQSQYISYLQKLHWSWKSYLNTVVFQAKNQVWQKGVCTYPLLLWDAHDVEGVHGLHKQVTVLLTRDGHVPVGQEAVVFVVLQTQLSWLERQNR